MKNKLFGLVSIFLILIIASFLYFYKLDKIPSGFYIDEAASAYNAYSITETGKDEFGKSFPILFRLFGSYSPPLFIYLCSVLIPYFGMGVSVFRSVSVVSAIISIVFFLLMTLQLKVYKHKASYFLITFFYAITPWLVFNARLGYEETLGYVIFNIGLYFLYLAFEKPKYFLLGLPILSLSSYASHNQKFLLPIFTVFFLLVFKKEIFRKENFKFLFFSVVIAVLVQIPNLSIITTNAFWIKNISYTNGIPIQKTAQNIIVQFLNYYSPKSLFYFLPDIDPQHTLSEISVMYNWMVIPYFLGLFLLFKKIKEKNHKFVAVLFFVSTVPAALSGEFISIQRALPFLFPLMIVIGIGIDFLLIKMGKFLAPISFLILAFYSLLMLYRSYFVLFPNDRAVAWSYGFADVADFIKKNPQENFFIDNSRNLGLYMELLYFLKYPPAKYQQEVTPFIKDHYYEAPILGTDFGFGKIRIGGIDWTKEIYKEQIIMGDSLAISDGQAREHLMTGVFQLKDPSGNIIFNGYKTNPKEKCKKELLKKNPSRYCFAH